MKKLISITLTLITLFCLLGCTKQTDEEILAKYITFYQDELYTYNCETFNVKVSSGKTEDIFIADGSIGNIVQYSTFTLIPKVAKMTNLQLAFTIIGENGEISGELEKNVLGISYSAKIDIKSIGLLKSVKISSSFETFNIELKNELIDKIPYTQAVNFAFISLKEEVSIDLRKNEFDREIYVKFINDKNSPSSPYYWYVSFIKSIDDYFSFTLNPKTGEIISRYIPSKNTISNDLFFNINIPKFN